MPPTFSTCPRLILANTPLVTSTTKTHHVRNPPDLFPMSSFNTPHYPGSEHPKHNPSQVSFVDILFYRYFLARHQKGVGGIPKAIGR